MPSVYKFLSHTRFVEGRDFAFVAPAFRTFCVPVASSGSMIARVRSSGPAILRGRERISAGECISKSPRVGEDIKVLCAAAPIKQQHGGPYHITFITFTTFTGIFLALPQLS